MTAITISILQYYIVPEMTASALRLEKEIKVVRTGKKVMELSIFTGNTTEYLLPR